MRPKQAVRQQQQQPLLIQQVDNRKTVSTSCCHHRTAAARSRSVGQLPALDWRGRWGGGKQQHCAVAYLMDNTLLQLQTSFCMHNTSLSSHTLFFMETFYQVWWKCSLCGGNCGFHVHVYTSWLILQCRPSIWIEAVFFFVSRNILNSPKVVFCILSFCLMHYFSNVFSVVILCLFFFYGLNIKTNCFSCRNGYNGVSAGFLDILARLYK